MALVAQEIPKVGLVMENARLVRWLKEVGDVVSVGEPLLELETEKSLVEIEATVGGRLAQKLLEVDQEAKVGDKVAWIEILDSADDSTEVTIEAVAPDLTMAAPPSAPASGDDSNEVTIEADARALRARAGELANGDDVSELAIDDIAQVTHVPLPQSVAAEFAASHGARASESAPASEEERAGRSLVGGEGSLGDSSSRLSSGGSLPAGSLPAGSLPESSLPESSLPESSLPEEVSSAGAEPDAVPAPLSAAALGTSSSGANDFSFSSSAPPAADAAAGGAAGNARTSASASDEEGAVDGAGNAAAEAGAGEGRVRSSPVARKVAAQGGIDIATIVGTGPQGRVQLQDVRRAIEAKSSQQSGVSERAKPVKLPSIRRAIARSMTLSNATVPQFFVERSVDWSALHEVRTSLNSKLSPGTPKLSVNDFLLAGISRALLAFPALNATFVGDPESPDAATLQANGTHIGLVVAVDNGLLVPVIHHVDQLSLPELARNRADIVNRALKGKLKQADLEGATFSLSNLGARGPDRFTAIINPPQSAILAVGRQRDCVVARNGGIHIRPQSELSLTVDHRVADGRLAADFLAYLVEILEGTDWRTE